jgi:hypothetical protein
MRCLVCGTEMLLVRVVQDTTMPVPGFEHQTWQCSACLDHEHRLVFTRKKTVLREVLVDRAQPEPPEADIPTSTQTDVEERGATTSTSEQVPRQAYSPSTLEEEAPVQHTGTEPANDVANAHVQERGVTPMNSEQATSPVQSVPAIEPQQTTAPRERQGHASAWARAVAKLRSWQTEKGGR